MVDYYRRVGFLPEGVLNALARLGWSLDDQTEIMSLKTITESFSLERVIRSPAGLDPDKMISFQSHWMTELPADQKLSECLRFLMQAKLIDDDSESTRQYVSRVIGLAGDRCVSLEISFQLDEFFVADDAITMTIRIFRRE